MIVFDVESNGLLEDATKIHCMVYRDLNGGTCKVTDDYDHMRKILLSGKPLLGHNIIRYDVPLLEKLLEIKIKSRLYDTLPMSWVLNPCRSRHGLDSFFDDYGIEKPKIEDWNNQSLEEYSFRCQQDVMITEALWKDLLERFLKIYNCKKMLDKFFRYLEFKMDCAKEAEQQGWKLDVDLVESCIDKMTKLQEEKVAELVSVMPMRTIYRKHNKPKVYQKKDGSLSALGQKWQDLVEEHGLPPSFNGEITSVKGVEDPNPNSTDQVKEWLTSLGWQPCTYKYNKNKETGEEKKVEQVRKNGELTKSVRLLINKNPAVGVLDGLTVLQHRLGILKSFIDCERGGYVRAEIDGLTNTLRFKHKKPLVNLPSVEKPYGKEIRSCLIATPGTLLCGADMTSLEDTTKRHYMMPYDPDYVKEMSVEGFDPHLDLAKHAKFVTQDQIDKHNRGEINLKDLRKNFKVVNYSATYGVGAEKLSRETGMSIGKSRKLLDAYWERNWSVKQFAEEQDVKEIGEEKWIQNPVSKFWHSLRNEKDAFSTINQSTGSYCFDKWVAIYRSKRSNIIGQFHDESINLVREGEEEEHTEVLKWAVSKLNEELKLNVELGIDVQYGKNYAEVH